MTNLIGRDRVAFILGSAVAMTSIAAAFYFMVRDIVFFSLRRYFDESSVDGNMLNRYGRCNWYNRFAVCRGSLVENFQFLANYRDRSDREQLLHLLTQSNRSHAKLLWQHR